FSKQIDALEKISKILVSKLYLEDILKEIVSVTAELLDSKICSLMLLDQDKKELVIRATQSVSEAYRKKPNIKVGEGIVGKVALEAKPAMVADVKKDPRYLYQEIAKKEKLCSLISLPLKVKEKVIGVLNVYTSRRHKFTEEEVKILSAVANQAAIAIENAELQLQSKKMAEELENRKLIERAKDLLSKEALISGEEAYWRMRKQSMDSRKSLREIAEAIILAKELKKDSNISAVQRSTAV
ncbi:MAG: GAF domain-containing protein, partial [Candidatus Margulisiibacteriota bacterium]